MFMIKMCVYKMTCKIQYTSYYHASFPPSPTKQCWCTRASYSFPVPYPCQHRCWGAEFLLQNVPTVLHKIVVRSQLFGSRDRCSFIGCKVQALCTLYLKVILHFIFHLHSCFSFFCFFRVNDCVVKVNNVDLTNVGDRMVALEAVKNSRGVLNMVRFLHILKEYMPITFSSPRAQH